MNLLTTVAKWCNQLQEKMRNKQETKRLRKLDNLSCEAINVMEFDGRLYVAFEGVPIVRTDDLKVKAPEMLAQAREDFLAWKEKFNK